LAWLSRIGCAVPRPEHSWAIVCEFELVKLLINVVGIVATGVVVVAGGFDSSVVSLDDEDEGDEMVL